MNNFPLSLESLTAFSEATDQLLPLIDQVETDNVRFTTANEVLADSPLLPTVRATISAEQAAHWDTLVESGNSIAYDAVATTDSALDAEIATLRTSLLDPALPTAREVAALEQQCAVAMELAPSSAEAIEQVMLEMQTKPEWRRRKELETRLDQVVSERLALDDVYDVAGAAWPIPQAFETNPDVNKSPEPEGDFELIEDIVPVDLKTQEKARCIHDKVDRTVDNPQASDYLKRYLIENIGKTVTVDELTQYLYTPEQIKNVDSYHLRSRITSPLGEAHGQPIRENLLSQGLTLQYGWRKRSVWSAETNTWRHNRPKRIYRLVQTDTLSEQDSDSAQQNTEGGRIADSWESTASATTSTIVHAPAEQRDSHAEISASTLSYVEAIRNALQRRKKGQQDLFYSNKLVTAATRGSR